VALASTFGPNTLQRFAVWADEVEPSSHQNLLNSYKLNS
jgi:hypothetical protein